MNVTAAHLSNEGYKSKKHVRMDGPASLESTNLYAPLLFECVLYKQKCMTSKGGKKKSIERNRKRQRKESDENERERFIFEIVSDRDDYFFYWG